MTQPVENKHLIDGQYVSEYAYITYCAWVYQSKSLTVVTALMLSFVGLLFAFSVFHQSLPSIQCSLNHYGTNR